MSDLGDVLNLRGNPPVAAELAEGVSVTTSPLTVSAPWLDEPIEVDPYASLLDEATTEVYDLPAILTALTQQPGPILLAPYACD